MSDVVVRLKECSAWQMNPTNLQKESESFLFLVTCHVFR